VDFVVVNSLFQETDIALFGLDDPVRLPETATMFDVLVAAKIFKSKSDARKNWKGSVDIPFGLNRFEVGKMKVEIYTLKIGEGQVEVVDHGKVGGPTETPKPPKPKEIVYRQPKNDKEYFIGVAGSIFSTTWPNRANFERVFKSEMEKYHLKKDRLEVVKYVGWEFRGWDWIKWGIKNVSRNGLKSWRCLLPFEWTNKYEIYIHYTDLGQGNIHLWVDHSELQRLMQ
jgi:hypothetical protein